MGTPHDRRPSSPNVEKGDADRQTALHLTPVSRETEGRLDQFIALLTHWQRTTNLVAPSTLGKIWVRHVADSLQLRALEPGARRWIDLGAGGGFPGMAIACALTGEDGAAVHLVESNGKKAAFLREAARITGAPAIVHARRIEDVLPQFDQPVDVVTARALAPLEVLLAQAYPLLKRGAVALFPKGQDVDAELTSASKYWTMDVTLVPSRTNPLARIVVVRHLTPSRPRKDSSA